MKFKARHFLFGIVAALLLIGLALQFLTGSAAAGPHSTLKASSLAERIPRNLAGGNVHDEPIAATEEMKKAVGELLNFNDGIYRIYQGKGYRVSVYVAWWEAGRMSPRLVATHTPDVCWPGNGWERDVATEGKLGDLSRELAATGFAAGECRVFTIRGTPEYVVFWHKIGGEMHSYKTGYAPPWWAMFDEIWHNGLDLKKEQLFVRISSDKPLEGFWSAPEMVPLRQALLELGLRAETKPEG